MKPLLDWNGKILLFLFLGLNSFSQNQWIQLNSSIEGGNIIRFTENKNGSLYCCTPVNVYRSTNLGDNWEIVSKGLPKLKLYSIHCTNRGFLFAATENGVYRTSDEGKTWKKVDAGFIYQKTFFLNSDTSGNIYAGQNQYLYISKDNGLTWEEYAKSIPMGYRGYYPYDTYPYYGKICFGKGNRIIVDYGVNLLLSTNSGISWAPIFNKYSPPTIAPQMDFKEDSATGFAVSHASVISADCSIDGFQTDFSSAAFDGNSVFSYPVLTQYWTQVIHSDVAFLDGNRFLLGLPYKGIVNACRVGGLPKPSYKNNGLRNLFIQCLYKSASGTVYAGTYGGGVYRSTDKGESWFSSSAGIYEPCIWTMMKTRSGNLMIGSGNGIFKSADDGATWTRSDAGLDRNFIICLFQTTKGTILCSNMDGIYRSSDEGNSWTRSDSGMQGRSANGFYTAGDGRLWAGTDSLGARYSRDDGKTWNESTFYNNAVGLDFVNVLCESADKKRLYAGTCVSVIGSSDSGKSWYGLTKGLNGIEVYYSSYAIRIGGHGLPFTYALDVDPERAYIYTSFYGGVFRMTPGIDETWINSSDGLTDKFIKTLQINQAGRLFSGSAEKGGVFVLDSAGENWKSFNKGLINPSIYSMLVDDESYLYVGTAGGGVFKTAEPTAILNAPVLQLPKKDSLNAPLNVLLQWRKTYYAKLYHLMVSKEDGSLVLFDTTLTTRTRLISGLEGGSKYYWKVRAVSGGVKSQWSEERMFSVKQQMPATVILRAPSIDSILSQLEVQLQWESEANASSYGVQLAMNPEMTLFVTNDTVGNVLNIQHNQLEYDRRYYWRVRAINSTGAGPWSSIWNFTTSSFSSVSENRDPFSIRVFPNPTDGNTKLTFTLEKGAIFSYEIFSAFGVCVSADQTVRLEAGEHEFKMNSSVLTQGIYFLRLNIGASRRTIKLHIIR